MLKTFYLNAIFLTLYVRTFLAAGSSELTGSMISALCFYGKEKHVDYQQQQYLSISTNDFIIMSNHLWYHPYIVLFFTLAL